ncbi:hypothetical protein ASPZODRAFT_102041 [Penicilliopsis zonata CBS 506.65]|uniref:Uncharacterized protein n=1 Tax=Penicilliopsis zonata CBS 506.65 TaxID=1073090 RepID=A0A1L9SA94_9EURO|nr:hypothetical protein ASPZODRAFT_102041 [Penicilliopsis zonata CBS 506.65]OJJ44084.1 hypothetical protein ASPZODRAFT_102041 [Penicilliopsis zonata CBS 506.65]
MSTNLRGFNHAVHTLLTNPPQFLPHLTIPTITSLPEQLGPHLQPDRTKKQPTIRALVLDKDNTLCAAKTTRFPSPILAKLAELRTSPTSPFNAGKAPHSILIVSNRAGSHPSYENEVAELEAQLDHLSIPVFRLPAGATKKPFCGQEVIRWFTERHVIESPDEIAVVGDRLGTDVLMAVQMGAWSVWCRDGIYDHLNGSTRPGNLLEKMEIWIERFFRERGCVAPLPRGFAV